MADQIQQLAQDVPFSTLEESYGGIGAFILITGQIDDEPEHWSPSRDSWLREFVKKTDPLKMVVGTFISKAKTIPIHIRARDRSVKKHVKDAATLERSLVRYSGLFRGFKNEFSKFIRDFLTQDNGGHMLVMGKGPASRPVTGPATGLLHLDSARCDRTGNPRFPIRYQHTDGKLYMLHYTRVISMSNMPDAEILMNDVGLCPISCCLMAAKEMRDIYALSSEKMGSRPQRQVLYVEEGATIEQLNNAVEFADRKLDSVGLKHFSKTLLLAPKVASQKLKLNSIDLTKTHEGFDRHDVTVIDMAMVAGAFKLDLRDVAFAFGLPGQTRADAEVQERKGRGKGVGDLLEAFVDELSLKYLPDHLAASFDNQDDEQDEQQALIWNIRSQARDRDMTSGVTTARVERTRMLANNELTEEQFDELELMDGRLPDGTDIVYLFYVEDPFGVADLVNTRKNQPDPTMMAADPMSEDPASGALVQSNPYEEILDRIDEAIKQCSIELYRVSASESSRKLRYQMAGLKKLLSLYELDPAVLGQESLIGEEQLLGEEDAAATPETSLA